MNHLAFDVPLERFEEYRQKLIEAGVEVSMVLDHDDSESRSRRSSIQACSCARSTSSIRTAIMLEFASWCRDMGRPGDVTANPVNEAGEPVDVG